jgi:predicted HAD superfamily Cof-like phosphohydrolase
MDYETFYNEAFSLYLFKPLTFEAWLKTLAEVASKHKFKFTELVEIVYSITGVRISTDEWFAVVLANDAPGTDRFPVQLGCHLEEVVEMLQEVYVADSDVNSALEEACIELTKVAEALKSGQQEVAVDNPEAFEDSLLDQLVTGTGLLKMRGADVAESVARVDVANFTKFVDGKPVYKDGGKVGKGPNFWNPEG